MKRLCLTLCILISTGTWSLGQTERPKPAAQDEKDASALAAAFFDRYQQTQDITPLIKEFFVSDFEKRLVFCRTTHECEGFARDFWKPPEHPLPFTPTDKDYVRQYAALINFFYLYPLAESNFALSAGQKPIDFEVEGQKLVSSEIKALLKGNSEALKYDFFENPDSPYTEPASIVEFRNRVENFEQLIAAVRIVESRSRAGLPKGARKKLSSREIQVNFAENGQSRFFDYPIHTQMFQVWPETDDTILMMDLIREKGKLKIVAVYPGMD